MAENFAKFTNSGSWPIRKIPYKGVTQLLPNHYLELNTGHMVRYWPNRPLERRSAAEAAEEMLKILSGIVSAAICRREVTISLSGGYDSRLVLASAKSHWGKVQFYTNKNKNTPHHDMSIPKKLSRRYGLRYSINKWNFGANAATEISNSELNDALQNNVGGMFYDPSLQGTQTVRSAVGKTLNLPGLISEVNRCFYYNNGVHPPALSPRDIAVRAGFKDNPVAEEGFAIWLSELPSTLPVNLLDLLYWEHRLGVWAACSLTFREGIIDAVPPMNCRRFLELGLSTDVEERKSPYALVRRMLCLADPTLLDFKFNYDWVDDWIEFRRHKFPIPWRLKKALGWL